MSQIKSTFVGFGRIFDHKRLHAVFFIHPELCSAQDYTRRIFQKLFKVETGRYQRGEETGMHMGDSALHLYRRDSLPPPKKKKKLTSAQFNFVFHSFSKTLQKQFYTVKLWEEHNFEKLWNREPLFHTYCISYKMTFKVKFESKSVFFFCWVQGPVSQSWISWLAGQSDLR